MLLTPDLVPVVVSTGASARLAAEAAAQFIVGQSVRVRNLHPVTHTRLPGYLRGRVGVVEIDHGVFVFPDTHAHGLGEKPQHCYSVRFAARELWGPSAPARDSLCADLFDDYLEPA